MYLCHIGMIRARSILLRTAAFVVATALLSFQCVATAQENNLSALEGEWLFVEDRTEGRPEFQQGPPMSVKFSLRVEKDAVIYPRPRGDEKITLDGSVVQKKSTGGAISRYRGLWKDGELEYTFESVSAENKVLYELRRVFRVTEDGLLVHVISNGKNRQVALYRHPKEIVLPKPAKATIVDLAWLTGAWYGKKRTSLLEERWAPARGGAMLAVSRTIRREKMVGFEFLRIVERDGGLVYIAQPGGRPPTEFVLAKFNEGRAEFVNPRHDYPQRIVYELSTDGELTASIGFAKGRLQSTKFQRQGKENSPE